MGASWTIAKKDLSQRVRDRSVFIIGVIAPLALALIFNLIFGGGISDVGQTITLDMGVVNEDNGPIAAAFTGVMAEIEASGLVELTTFPSEAAARTAVDDGQIGAAFLLGPGLSTSLLEGRDTSLGVVGNVDAPTTTQIATAIAEQFALGVRQGNVAAITGLVAGVIDPADAAAAAQEAASAPLPIAVGTVEAATRQLDSSTFFVAGLSIFFIFFVAGMSVTSMLDERREGTMSRLLAAPIPRAAITAGKSLTSVIVGLVAMLVLVVASTFMMGADWGAPVGVAILVVVAVLAIVAIMSLAGGFARTAEQAGNLQSIVAVTLAMLGGTFVPIAPDGGVLSQLSLITPNAWFIRGLGDLAGGTVADVLPAAGVLALMAVVAGAIGIFALQKGVEQ